VTAGHYPKIIHRLWLGPEAMPRRYREYGHRWETLNPGWSLRDWSYANMPPVINVGVWDAIRANGANPGMAMPPDQAIAVQRADMLSYELLARYGGVYVNCDIEPLRPMDDLLEVTGDAPWAGYEDGEYLVNSAMGGHGHSPFWDLAVSTLPDRYFSMPGRLMNQQTGPWHLTDLAAAHGMECGLVKLPREAFNYAHHSAVPPGSDASDFRGAAIEAGAFGLHHWGHRLTIGG